jgi:hypothetical protein
MLLKVNTLVSPSYYRQSSYCLFCVGDLGCFLLPANLDTARDLDLLRSLPIRRPLSPFNFPLCDIYLKGKSALPCCVVLSDEKLARLQPVCIEVLEHLVHQLCAVEVLVPPTELLLSVISSGCVGVGFRAMYADDVVVRTTGIIRAFFVILREDVELQRPIFIIIPRVANVAESDSVDGSHCSY